MRIDYKTYALPSVHHFDSSVIAALPTWPYSAGWGYYPSGGLGLVLLIVLLVVLLR
jgi:hypothetical protein